jgi:hypothetical protein
MHLRHSDHDHGPPIVPVKFLLEDPEGLTETEQKEWDLMGSEGESLLELAVEHGINIEHACGGSRRGGAGPAAEQPSLVPVRDRRQGTDRGAGAGVEPQRDQGSAALSEDEVRRAPKLLP